MIVSANGTTTKVEPTALRLDAQSLYSTQDYIRISFPEWQSNQMADGPQYTLTKEGNLFVASQANALFIEIGELPAGDYLLQYGAVLNGVASTGAVEFEVIESAASSTTPNQVVSEGADPLEQAETPIVCTQVLLADPDRSWSSFTNTTSPPNGSQPSIVTNDQITYTGGGFKHWQFRFVGPVNRITIYSITGDLVVSDNPWNGRGAGVGVGTHSMGGLWVGGTSGTVRYRAEHCG